MADKQQAIIDAITDIQMSRLMQGGGGSGGKLPPEITIKVDPNLNKPQPKQLQSSPQNLKINDPKGLLDRKQKQQSPQGPEGGNGPTGGPSGQPGPNGQGSGEGKEQKPTGEPGKPGENENGEENDPNQEYIDA